MKFKDDSGLYNIITATYTHCSDLQFLILRFTGSQTVNALTVVAVDCQGGTWIWWIDNLTHIKSVGVHSFWSPLFCRKYIVIPKQRKYSCWAWAFYSFEEEYLFTIQKWLTAALSWRTRFISLGLVTLKCHVADTLFLYTYVVNGSVGYDRVR